ncbi:MAG TPA: hypothetical protein VEZ70_09080 [Allosphingosinicella sp.]|nr:hypothetical protein [Allosphingosinicella sp.]
MKRRIIRSVNTGAAGVRHLVLGVLLSGTCASPLSGQSTLTDPNESQALSGSGGTSDQWTQMKAQAESQTAAYNAAKASAEAQKAAIEAETAAAKAKFGGVTGQTTITGAVEGAEGSARAEAMLLVSRATVQAADGLAARVAPALKAYPERKLLVLTDLTQLATGDAVQFEVQLGSLAKQLQAAADDCETALQTARGGSRRGSGGRERGAFIPMLGGIMDTAVKLGSYFQTDYKFGSVQVTETTNLTAAAVANALRTKGTAQPIIIPATILASDPQPLVADLAPVQDQYARAIGLAAAAKRLAADTRQADPAGAARLDAAEARATKALTAYESFATALTTSSEGKEAPVVRIVRQKLVRKHLASSPLVLLVTSDRAGAYYTKKNLWTFLGGPPLYTMGGVSLVYSLFDPADDNVLQSGAVTKHGGYRSVRAVEKLFN